EACRREDHVVVPLPEVKVGARLVFDKKGASHFNLTTVRVMCDAPYYPSLLPCEVVVGGKRLDRSLLGLCRPPVVLRKVSATRGAPPWASATEQGTPGASRPRRRTPTFLVSLA